MRKSTEMLSEIWSKDVGCSVTHTEKLKTNRPIGMTGQIMFVVKSSQNNVQKARKLNYISNMIPVLKKCVIRV